MARAVAQSKQEARAADEERSRAAKELQVWAAFSATFLIICCQREVAGWLGIYCVCTGLRTAGAVLGPEAIDDALWGWICSFVRKQRATAETARYAVLLGGGGAGCEEKPALGAANWTDGEGAAAAGRCKGVGPHPLIWTCRGFGSQL